MSSEPEPWVGLAALAQAHSHLDCDRGRPLEDALSHGFTSVEADVWLIDGVLSVAHDRDAVREGYTLEELYLGPLQHRVTAAGAIHPGWSGSLQLMVDIKSDPEPTYEALHNLLHTHASILTSYHGAAVRPGAVEVVVSGKRPRELMLAQPLRYAAYDGRLDDLGRGLPPTFMPLISTDWRKQFVWRGVGPMFFWERRRLRTMVARAHAEGHRFRFWGTRDRPGRARTRLWAALVDAGVDHINTDDLPGLEAFLRKSR